MFTKSADQEITFKIASQWMLLVFCAGVMNSVAFIGLGTFATHVTGFATLFGVSVGERHFSNAGAALAVPMFFLVGAILSGLAIEARIRRQLKPHYDYVMYGSSFLLLVSCALARLETLDPSYKSMHVSSNFFILSMICLSSGVVNAALSYSSRATIRITHLTGVTTDLGRGLAELISLSRQGVAAPELEVQMNYLRVLTIGIFIVGSITGAFLYHEFKFNALFVPCAYFAYAGFHAQKHRDKY